MEFHCIPDSWVRLSCRSDIWVEQVILISEDSVVGALRRCNIQLDIEVCLWDRIFSHSILIMQCVVPIEEASTSLNVISLTEVYIDISSGVAVVVRRSALAFMNTTSSDPVILDSTTVLINVLDGCARDFVVFVVCEIRRGQLNYTKVRTSLSQKIRIELSRIV